EFLCLILRLVERQNVLAVAVLEVIGERKTLGPVGAVTIAGLEHPGAVGLIAAVHQRDAARERWATVRPAANFQSEPCAAAFQGAEANFACHESFHRSREVSR